MRRNPQFHYLTEKKMFRICLICLGFRMMKETELTANVFELF